MSRTKLIIKNMVVNQLKGSSDADHDVIDGKTSFACIFEII